MTYTKEEARVAADWNDPDYTPTANDRLLLQAASDRVDNDAPLDEFARELVREYIAELEARVAAQSSCDAVRASEDTAFHVLSLVYDIMFNDSDNGSTCAGTGRRLISVHKSREEADKIAAELNPIIAQAEKETIVFPVQKFNSIVKDRLGATLHDVESDGEEFHLVVESFDTL